LKSRLNKLITLKKINGTDMNIKINANILRDGLNKVLTVIDKKNARPILTNCLINCLDNSIEIIATDLEVTAKILLEAQTNSKGSFCINTKNFFDIVRELPENELYIAN
jgi:DNA polymerase-3 subunit beta